MGYIEGKDRTQATLLPDCIDDYISEDNPVRFIDAFVNELDFEELEFVRSIPAETGRPGYHPRTLLSLYIYGYLNRIQSSRRRPFDRMKFWESYPVIDGTFFDGGYTPGEKDRGIP